MTDTNVKIRAKGCASTGVTDDLATQMYANKGSRYMAIIELKVEETHEKADGDRKVDLIITELEPVVDGKLNGTLDEHVRTIQAALYRNRKLVEDGQTLPFDSQGDEPTVEGVIAAGRALVEEDEDGPKLWDGVIDGEDDEAEAEDLAEEPCPCAGQGTTCESCDPYDEDDEPAQAPASVLQFSGKAPS